MNRRLLLIMSHCWCTGHTAPPAHGYFSFFSFGLADIGALRVHFQQFSSVSSVSLQTKKCKDSEREWRHLSACSSQVGWQRHYPLKKKKSDGNLLLRHKQYIMDDNARFFCCKYWCFLLWLPALVHLHSTFSQCKHMLIILVSNRCKFFNYHW